MKRAEFKLSAKIQLVCRRKDGYISENVFDLSIDNSLLSDDSNTEADVLKEIKKEVENLLRDGKVQLEKRNDVFTIPEEEKDTILDISL